MANVRSRVREHILFKDPQEDLVMRVAAGDFLLASNNRLDRIHTRDKYSYESFLRLLGLPLPSDSASSLEESAKARREASGYLRAAMRAAQGCRPFLSRQDHIGLVPESAEIGDIICIIYGASVPFALRPDPDGRYRRLGEAYVHGIMDGEFMETAPAAETFVLR
jgi:hypothetical protein